MEHSVRCSVLANVVLLEVIGSFALAMKCKTETTKSRRKKYQHSQHVSMGAEQAGLMYSMVK